MYEAKFMKKSKFVISCVFLASAAGQRRTPVTNRSDGETVAPPDLYPGVWRAGVLLCPERRRPCGSVIVHVVTGGFQSMRLRAEGGRVSDDLLQIRVVVAVWVLQVHSVCIVVSPARLI